MPPMTEPLPLAAVLYVNLAGSTLMRKELAESMRQRGARVLNGEGGAIVAIFSNGDAAPSACVQAAIECQHAARRLGVGAHAAVSCGPLKMGDASGGANLEGACVTMAARLHKLMAERPGLILVDGATRDHINMGLRLLCRPAGSHDFEGAGSTEVFSLAWNEEKPAAPDAAGTGHLAVSIGRVRHVFKPGDTDKDAKVGRSPTLCTLVIPIDIVSAQHALLSYESGQLFLEDTSRHGTWLRESESGNEVRVHGSRAPLAAKGAICLGRSFANDPQGTTTLEFERVE